MLNSGTGGAVYDVCVSREFDGCEVFGLMWFELSQLSQYFQCLFDVLMS